MKVSVKIEKEVKYLKLDAGVRYWEDSVINGVEDNEDSPCVPCQENGRWKPVIELETGKILNWTKGVEADIHYKICDDGGYILLDEWQNKVIDVQSYVPNILCPTGEGYGDYIIMRINEDGMIQDWKCRESDLGELIENAF